MDTNKIEKQILLKAPRSRVWRAITDSKEFGAWFGMKLNGPFRAGEMIKGQIAPTQADPEVGKLQEPHAGKPVEMFVEKIQPETQFCLKWHPYAIDPNVDYSKEPMTLITFTLEEKENGTLLTITETGFENIPLSRRLEAIKANDGGWEYQTKLIEKYLKMAR